MCSYRGTRSHAKLPESFESQVKAALDNAGRVLGCLASRFRRPGALG